LIQSPRLSYMKIANLQIMRQFGTYIGRKRPPVRYLIWIDAKKSFCMPKMSPSVIYNESAPIRPPHTKIRIAIISSNSTGPNSPTVKVKFLHKMYFISIVWKTTFVINKVISNRTLSNLNK